MSNHFLILTKIEYLWFLFRAEGVSFTTYFNKSQCVTAVTTRVTTATTLNKVYAKRVGIITFKKIEANRRMLYFAALHFEGLNRTRYGALQKRVHEAFLISGNSTMSKSINRTILMASQHDMERGFDLSGPIKTQTGVVCI